MKRFLLIISLIILGATTVGINAQTKEYKKQMAAYEKMAENIAKKQAKDLKKAKWEYTGVLPLEIALKNYYLETVPECGGEKRGIDHEVNAATVSAGEKSLLLNAQALYAQEIEAMLGADLANDTRAENDAAFEAYVARVASKVKHEFQGDISRAILLKKPTPNGKGWVVRGYFIIDEAAGQLRAKRIADEIARDNETIDAIHDKVFGDE